MYYGQSMPWPLKVAIFTAATLAGYAPGAAPDAAPLVVPDAALRVCYAALVLFALASTLPSLCFSVRCRRETTTFVAQSALMLFAVGVFLAVVRAAEPDTRAYGCVSLLVLATHYLYMVFRALSRSPQLLLYSSGVAAGAIALAVGVVGVLVPRLPALRMHGVVALCLLFAGEVLGLGVFLLDAVFRAVADGAERCIEERL